MNSFFKILAPFFLSFVMLMTSCTDEVGDSEINIIQGSADSVKDVSTAVGMLKEAMYLVHDSREHKYQYQFNLHIDNYCGYMCVANSLEGRLPSTYYINPSFESGPLVSLLWVTRNVAPVMNSADKLGIPELGEIANIIYNYCASQVVDVYGPLPYFAYRNLQTDPPVKYDSVSVVYKTVLKELAKSQQALKDMKLSAEAKSRLKELDRIGRGDVNNWIKFANTVRLRLAMRMVKVEPELAKQEAEAAYAAGILGNDDKDIEIDLAGGKHPLYTISVIWDDSRLNASFGNILKRLNSPMLEKWFSPVAGDFVNNKGERVFSEGETVYAGIRTGSEVFNKKERQDAYLKFSKLNAGYFGVRNIALVKVSEALFLCAEAKLRGWNCGSETTRKYYELGVKKSLRDNGVTSNSYLGQKTVKDITYVDLWNSNNNWSENLCNSPVRWNNNYTDEQKLEQIITQKYIAIFPCSLEAWSELRRTGYPKVIPAVYDGGDNSIPTGGIIRRMTFQTSGSVSLDDVSSSAIPALKAEDTSGFDDDAQGARLWWDVKGKGNF